MSNIINNQIVDDIRNLLINSRILIQDSVSFKSNNINYQQEKNLLIGGLASLRPGTVPPHQETRYGRVPARRPGANRAPQKSRYARPNSQCTGASPPGTPTPPRHSRFPPSIHVAPYR